MWDAAGAASVFGGASCTSTTYGATRLGLAASPLPRRRGRLRRPTPTATPNPCTANLGVTVAPDGAGRLQVTLSARSGSLARVQMVADAHVPTPNALFDVPGGPTGARSLNLQPGTAQYGFDVRPATSGQAATVPLVITDGCGGQWSTLVGGGPAVFSGPAAAPQPVAVERAQLTASTPTPRGPAASTPTPTRTPTRAAAGR